MASTLDSLERIEFKKGEFLFREGDETYHFFMIEEGEVEILLHNPQDPTEGLRLATLGPGQPVGEFALITKKTRSATARAKTPCRVVKISQEGYQQLLTELPGWALSLIESLIERLNTTDERLRKIQFKDEITQTHVQNILDTNYG